MNTTSMAACPAARTRFGPGEALLVTVLLLNLVGCEPSGNPDLISGETFIEYYTTLLRAQEKARGDPAGLAPLLELESFPDGWREQMIAFAEEKPLSARGWADLLAEAHARSEKPTDR